MLSSGAGGVVTKSIGPHPKDGHAGPCLVVLEDGLLNAMGLPNPSKEFADEITCSGKKTGHRQYLWRKSCRICSGRQLV